MSRRLVGIILLAVGSLLLGYLGGSYAFRLFDKTVPPAVITDLVRGTAHAAYISLGVVFGIVIFAWTLLAVVASRFFPAPPGGAPRTPPAP